MKKLFYILLCLPLVMAACTKEDAPVDTPKEYTELKVTSELTLSFEAEGGEGVITYDLVKTTRATETPQVKASCNAAWVSNLAVAETITFDVAANEGEARNTTIVVSYGEQSVEVKVNQMEKATIPQPQPEFDVEFEAQVLTGEYYGDYYTPDAGNYYIFFSDYGFTEEGNLLTNSIYYQLDLYGVLYDGEAVDGYIPLPEGTYTLDMNDTMALGTIGYSYSCYMKTNSSEIEVEVSFDAAELVVAADGSCVLTATIEGKKHKVTFAGTSTIEDKREVNTGGDNVEMEAGYADATYYGDQYSPGVADNFYFFLSDKGFDADGWELPNATYYRFDLFSNIVNPEKGLAIPYGTYTIDNGSKEPFTMGTQYSAYYIMDSEGWDYAVSSAITSGSVTISEDGVVADLMIAGAHHVVTFSGDIIIVDSSDSGEGGGGEGPYSTLLEDYRCNLGDHTLYYAYYGDYYEVGYMNWTFAVMPNDGEGDFVQFDVLAGANSTTNFVGEYAINDSFEAYTSYPGYIDWDGYMVGAWYYTEDGVTMAPFVDGTMSVADNGDGTVTVEFDVYDDCDNNITGSWTGEIKSAEELQTRSAVVKKGAAKQSHIPAKSAIKATKSDISKF